MRRGKVWWVDDPESGRRRHLVLSRDSAIPVLNAVIAVPARSTVRGIPTEVRLGPDDGMPADCALTLDNVAVLPKERFVERICTLQFAPMSRVCRALAVATACRL